MPMCGRARRRARAGSLAHLSAEAVSPGRSTLVAMIVLFGLEQRAWYRQLAPDVRNAGDHHCLDRLGVRAATRTTG